MAMTSADQRIEQLNAVSARRVIEPDVALPGALGEGRLLPDELLSIAGLDLELTPEQRARLSREEVASITQAGIRFEAVLTAGFGLVIARTRELRSPSVTYLLHEIGEESRHSRLFVRLLDQIDPQAVDPFSRGVLGFVSDRAVRVIIGFPALLYVLVLAGEEIPDLLQKLAGEHPDTDPMLRAVNQYHRKEEARHLAFARMTLPDVWRQAGPIDRFAVRFVAPIVIRSMFELIVHPGVYATVGLPGWKTWWNVRNSPTRVNLRHRALRPVLEALQGAGIIRRGAVPRWWRSLCGVDHAGTATEERAPDGVVGAVAG
jgi:P-aminobenzoate N-oxygenase AurF